MSGKIEIYNLMIEVTRRCNAKCDHCLRGKAENKVMCPEHLEALFSKLDYVSNITFTGGEPSLHPEVIVQTVEIAEKYGVDIGSFYIVTNAIEVTDAFLLAIMRLWCYCDDNECSGVHWSNDPYHPEMNQENTRRLSVFGFAGAKFEKNAPPVFLSDEGRAKKLHTGRKRKVETHGFEVEGHNIREGEVYLNCDGNIIDGCDWSYAKQRAKSRIVCPVSDFKIEHFTDEEPDLWADEEAA